MSRLGKKLLEGERLQTAVMSVINNSIGSRKWTRSAYEAGFPVLVAYAFRRRPITYGQWDAEVGKLGVKRQPRFTKYGLPAGVVGDACEAYARFTGMEFPPLNLLVVAEVTKMPGNGADGYTDRWLKRKGLPLYASLPIDKKAAVIRQTHQEIFNFTGWPDVLKACGLKPPRGVRRPAISSELPARLPRQGWATGPESDLHKHLKVFIKDNPGAIRLHGATDGRNEVDLQSGDKVDVMFESKSLAVEVKTSEASNAEIIRGVYQCVKYRALLGAEQISEGKIPTGNCYLASDGLFTNRVKRLCELFEVIYFEKVGHRSC